MSVCWRNFSSICTINRTDNSSEPSGFGSLRTPQPDAGKFISMPEDRLPKSCDYYFIILNIIGMIESAMKMCGMWVLPLDRHSSKKSLAKTMPRKGFPISNLMLKTSRVQLIFTENCLLDAELLDQQPCTYNNNIWYSTLFIRAILFYCNCNFDPLFSSFLILVLNVFFAIEINFKFYWIVNVHWDASSPIQWAQEERRDRINFNWIQRTYMPTLHLEWINTPIFIH